MEQGEKENKQAKRVEHSYGRKKDGRACRHCFDATHPGYQILLHDLIGQIDDSWQVSDDYWMNIFLIPWKYLRAHECYWSQSIEPQKKHHNLTGLITLLKCYWPMCYRINASGWIHGIKTMPSGSRTIFFSPRPCLAEVTCRFFLHRST